MSPEENKALFFRYQDALRARNPDDLRAVLAPDFVGHDLPPGLPPGPEGLILFRTKANQAFPDQKIVAMEELLAVDDRVVARFIMTQTHQGVNPRILWEKLAQVSGWASGLCNTDFR